MQTQGTCGRGGRHYGQAEDVLRGRLMDEREPRPAVRAYSWADVEAECWPGAEQDPEDGGHDSIDNELVRWGWELADGKYLEWEQR